MIGSLMSTTKNLVGTSTQLPGDSKSTIDPTKRAEAKRKAAERLSKQSRKPQSKQPDAPKDGDEPKDILDYLFEEFERKENDKPRDVIGMMVDDFNKKKNSENINSLPTKVGPDGDAVFDDKEMPGWMKNTADPLGIQKVQDEIMKATNPREAVPAILDITPKNKAQARLQLKELYDEEPTQEAVDQYWNDLQGRAQAPKFQILPDATIISEDQTYLRENPNAMTWKQYEQKLLEKTKFTILPDATIISEDVGYLRAHPNAMTWKQYENKLLESAKPKFTILPDATIISEDAKYLRENPNAMTWNQYEQKLLKDAKQQKAVPVDQKIVDEAVADLKELLGRDPTPKEVENFLEDMSEDLPAKKQSLDPFGFGDNEHPNAPYSMSDAIKEIKEITGRRPTNEEVNDWLYEMNEPFSHDQLYLDVGLPGYTEVYGPNNPAVDNSSMLNGYNIFFVLLAAGVATAAYKWRRRGENDDEFVKADTGSSLLNKLKNPFNRNKKNDNDDDFDKVL